MRLGKGVVGLAAVALLAAVAVPAAGVPTAGVSHESFRIEGVLADGSWFSEAEVPVGEPQVVGVFGADAMETMRVKGSKPMAQPMASGAAFATMLLDPDTGEPFLAEVWALAESSDFSVADDLSEATLEFAADAEVFRIDPETGMEEPTGMTIPLAVSAQWTAIGPQSTSKSHSKYTQEGMFGIDRAFMTSRGAQVAITISGPDWTFEVVGEGQIMDLRAGTITHFWPDVMAP
jgi:hypothetical protein